MDLKSNLKFYILDTQAEYLNASSINENALYFCKDGYLYRGSILIAQTGTEIYNALQEALKGQSQSINSLVQNDSALMELINLKANSSDVYTIETINAILAEIYSKEEVDGKLENKADSASVYTKDEIDKKLEKVVESDDIYNKNEVDSMLAEKANSSRVEALEGAVGALDGSVSANTTGLANLSGTVATNYNESIIGLSVDGLTVTYIKGDGSTHSFQTQDTNTTYSLATDEVTGLTKLYATIGSAEDGTMTQQAITTELNKKVGVSIDKETLVFTI